jgi:hypothetical protein
MKYKFNSLKKGRVYHATKYMALPNILLHDPALEGLILDCQVIKIKNLQKKSS